MKGMGKYAWKVMLAVFCSMGGSSDVGASIYEEEADSLDFAECVRIMMSNSLEMKAAENRKNAAEWRYKAYQASRKPQLLLQATPLQYNSTFVSRYDYVNDREVYRNQKTLYSYGGLTLSQPVFGTGGTFYMRSDLNYVHNMGVSNYAQFSSVPLQIGYSQEWGKANEWKWNKKEEELNWEREQKLFGYTKEYLIQQVADAFFALYAESVLKESAGKELGIADTLFREGKEREKMRAIKEGDLAVLEMDYLDALNEWEEALIRLNTAEEQLNRLLDRTGQVRIDVSKLPVIHKKVISVEKCIEAVKRNHAALLEWRMQELELKRSWEEAKRKRFGEGTISANVGFNQVASDFPGAYRNLLHGELATVSVTIPLLDWGNRKAQMKMAEYNWKNTKLEHEKEERALEAQIRELVARIEKGYAIVERSRKAFEAGQTAYQDCLQRYQKGLETAGNLSTIRNRFHVAEQNYVRAQQNYWNDFYELKAMTLLPL
ncbi:MAG: TolC family protein [Bacteroidaceae bacterium]|jgi:outer membrane protein TolC